MSTASERTEFKRMRAVVSQIPGSENLGLTVPLTAGASGQNGLNGRDGRDGRDGLNGINGQNGLNGRDGDPGAPGADGTDGINMISTWTLNGDETSNGGMRLSITGDCPKLHRIYLNYKDVHDTDVTAWKNYLVNLLSLPNASDVTLNFGSASGDTATFIPTCVILTHSDHVIQITGKFTSSTGSLSDIENLDYESLSPIELTGGIFVKGASSQHDVSFRFSGNQNLVGGMSVDTSNYVAGVFPYNATIRLNAIDAYGTKSNKFYSLLHNLLSMPNDSDVRIDVGDPDNVRMNFTPTCAETNCHGIITIHGRVNSQSCYMNSTDLTGDNKYNDSLIVHLSVSLKGTASTNSVLKWNFTGDACHPGGMRLDSECHSIFIRVNKIDANGNDNRVWKNWLENLLSLQDTTHILINIGDADGNSLNARPTCLWTCDSKINIHAKVVSTVGSVFSDISEINYTDYHPTMFVSVNVKGEYGVGTSSSWRSGGPPCEPGYLYLDSECQLATLQINPQDVNFADKTEMFKAISSLLQTGAKILITISNGTTTSSFYALSCKSGCQYYTLIGPKINVHCLEGCRPYVVSYQVVTEEATGVRFLESVVANTDLLTTYPNPQIGDSAIEAATGDLWTFSRPGSIKFDQCGSQYLTVPQDIGFNFGTQSFCVEGWIYVNRYSGWSGETVDDAIFGNIVHMTNGSRTFSLAVSSKGYWRAIVNYEDESDQSDQFILNYGSDENTSLPVRTWVHFALIRNAGNVFLHVNGLPLTPTSGVVPDFTAWDMGFSNQTLGIGAASDGTNRGNYQLSNLRITNNATVYCDSPFAVRRTALTSDGDTVLLLSTQALSTAFTDSSGSPKTITNNGGVSFSSLGPQLTPTVFTNVGHVVRPSLSENFMVGIGDSHKIGYSYDGISWLSSESGTSLFSAGCCKSVAWNGEIWLATGGDGATSIAYSSDGINWKAVHCDPFNGSGGGVVNGVAWNGSKWVAVGSDGSGNSIATSRDGMTWCSHTGPFDGAGLCVATNGTLWVAGGCGCHRVAYSVDGVNWSTSDSGDSLLTCHAKSVAWNGTTWVAGGSGSNDKQIIYSTDGISWDSPYCPEYIFGGGSCNTVAWNGSLWLAGGSSESGDRIFFSRNGRHWTSSTGEDGNATSIFTNDCKSIAWNGTVWVAGGGGDNHVAYSVDGQNWTVSDSGDSVFTCHSKSLAARRPLAPLVTPVTTTVSCNLRGDVNQLSTSTSYYCLPGVHLMTAGVEGTSDHPPAVFEVVQKPVYFTGISCALDVAMGSNAGTPRTIVVTANLWKACNSSLENVYTAAFGPDSTSDVNSDPGSVLCNVGDKIQIQFIIDGGGDLPGSQGKNLTINLKLTA